VTEGEEEFYHEDAKGQKKGLRDRVAKQQRPKKI
jgi:hypothetical protein